MNAVICVKSSPVKSSSNFNGGRARRLWGARRRERSGGRGAAQLAWLESPEPGLLSTSSHRLLLDHRGAAPQVTNFVPISGSLLYGNANPIQADVRRRERSGACARAVPVGQGIGRVWRPRRRRESSERGRARPFSDEFLAFGARQGPINHSWGQTRAAGAAAAKRSRTCSLSARHTPEHSHLGAPETNPRPVVWYRYRRGVSG